MFRLLCFFFSKRRTAYELRISDWSSDVCSSDLFRPGYVSDEEFDRWLVAADCLVLPYREIWSSSVIERAGIYGVPVIATDVGGLAAQGIGRASSRERECQ